MSIPFELSWTEWSDPAAVRRELDRGADPNLNDGLFEVVTKGTSETLAIVLPHVTDIDRFGTGDVGEGRTALWTAVFESKHEMSRMLAAAGADPWRDQMAGWSPGRLALAGPDPHLFGVGPDGVGLTDDELDLQEGASRCAPACTALASGLGWSVCFVAGVDADDAVRRLGASDAKAVPGGWAMDDSGSWAGVDPYDLTSRFGGPGLFANDCESGCVLVHPDSYDAKMPGVVCRVAADTRAYAVFDNAKSGRQGSYVENGVLVDWDLSPGGSPPRSAHHRLQILAAFLARQAGYEIAALIEACCTAGVFPEDPRCLVGPYRRSVRLPEGVDWWSDGVRSDERAGHGLVRTDW